MSVEKATSKKEQYTLWQIFAIWLSAGAPMLLTIGLIWQFILSMIILYREEGNIRIKTIRRRFWLNNPVSPKTGEKNNKLWWWIIPLLLLTVATGFLLSGPLNDLWVTLFPFLTEPAGYNAAVLFETPGKWVGAWNLLALFTVLAVFNTFLGEEFIFRGVLLPKMEGVFGKWDWVANGVIFGVYHLHQPWGLPGNVLAGLIFAFSGKHFRTNWFPIILHSGQSVFFFILILGMVLGLA